MLLTYASVCTYIQTRYSVEIYYYDSFYPNTAQLNMSSVQYDFQSCRLHSNVAHGKKKTCTMKLEPKSLCSSKPRPQQQQPAPKLKKTDRQLAANKVLR